MTQLPNMLAERITRKVKQDHCFPEFRVKYLVVICKEEII